MNDAPDDILQTIFETYTHHLHLSPANLLTVCRRWNALLLSTYGLWSRVNIHLDSFDAISYLTDVPVNQTHSPLCMYLLRSIPQNSTVGLPLDITIRSHFNNLEEGYALYMADLQLRDLLHCLTGRQPGVVQNTTLLGEEFIPRWRSFEIDFGSVTFYLLEFPTINLQKLWAYGRTPLPLLERLVAENVNILLSDKEQMPKLKLLNLRLCDINIMPNLQSIHRLSTRVVFTNRNFSKVNWEECGNVKMIYIDPNLPFEIPRNHSFPHLTCIRLDHNARVILPKLGVVFNDSRPLKGLEILEGDPRSITLGFRQALPDFRVMEVSISSRGFSGRPGTKSWDWLKYGEYTWDVMEQHVKDTSELLQELSLRPGLKVVAMDAHMEAILNLCKQRM